MLDLSLRTCSLSPSAGGSRASPGTSSVLSGAGVSSAVGPGWGSAEGGGGQVAFNGRVGARTNDALVHT